MRSVDVTNALGDAASKVARGLAEAAKDNPKLQGQIFETCWIGCNYMKPVDGPEGEAGNWVTSDLSRGHWVVRAAFEYVPEGTTEGNLSLSGFARRSWSYD